MFLSSESVITHALKEVYAYVRVHGQYTFFFSICFSLNIICIFRIFHHGKYPVCLRFNWHNTSRNRHHVDSCVPVQHEPTGLRWAEEVDLYDLLLKCPLWFFVPPTALFFILKCFSRMSPLSSQQVSALCLGIRASLSKLSEPERQINCAFARLYWSVVSGTDAQTAAREMLAELLRGRLISLESDLGKSRSTDSISMSSICDSLLEEENLTLPEVASLFGVPEGYKVVLQLKTLESGLAVSADGCPVTMYVPSERLEALKGPHSTKESLPDLFARYLPGHAPLCWGFGPETYQFARKTMGMEVELFASPLNRTLPLFCSPFPEDSAFGSWGPCGCRTFWEGLESASGKRNVMANPPHSEEMFRLCADLVKRICERFEDAVVLIIIPDLDMRSVGITALRKLSVHEVVLEAGSFVQWDYGTDSPFQAAFAARLILCGGKEDEGRWRLLTEDLGTFMRSLAERYFEPGR